MEALPTQNVGAQSYRYSLGKRGRGRRETNGHFLSAAAVEQEEVVEEDKLGQKAKDESSESKGKN